MGDKKTPKVLMTNPTTGKTLEFDAGSAKKLEDKGWERKGTSKSKEEAATAK